jgi:hypothetical protein
VLVRKSAIILALVLALAALGAGGLFVYKTVRYAKETVPEAVEVKSIPAEEPPESAKSADGSAETDAAQETGLTPETASQLPEDLNLKMVFYSQAPFGNWDYPWQEACEEASVLLIANEYLEKNWTADDFNEELLKLVDWEKTTFGDYKHTNVQQTVKILNEYLDLKTVVYDDPTFEDVQKVLARGHFIVMPFAGKRLGNPFYKNGGPVYHMMVVKGYKDGEKIITSDVGTRNGENYVYSWNTIVNAMHDYAEPIEDGAQRMIEVIPPSV